ncbi:MAG: protein-L-isoaspartate O-methyltransferase, partial [Candidatus Omnitrophica bacterium CG12_big_fil_rev_8_21_14_0_65_50_5]
RLGNGWQGWPEEAPFDRIIVTAAPDQIPPALVDQLRDGGLMIIPVGTEHQQLVLGVKKGGSFQKVEALPVRFVPLVGKEEAAPS